jgi:GT2 family glycosyltransferase/glycosyltransferase involved in cell wall biosynthesis
VSRAPGRRPIPQLLALPLTLPWRFLTGLPPFLREMRGFARRARYTVATRGLVALYSDIVAELARRLRHGTLAAPPSPQAVALASATATPEALRESGDRRRLEFPTADEPSVSVIIPVLDEFERTYVCLASILERSAGVPYEILVVDDGSSDETRELESLVGGVKVLRNETNLGFIAACNRGAALARGEFLVFLNNDTLVCPDWLTPLLAPFGDSAPGRGAVGLVGAKLVYPDGRLQECGGIVFSDGSGWNYGRGDDPADPRYEFTYDADYCSGACIAIPRGLFERLGGFDTRYAPMYYEDVDLAFAVRAAGLRVLCQPTCVIVHSEGGTAGVDTGSGAKRYQLRNRERFVERWSETLAEQPSPNANPDAARYRGEGGHVLVIDATTPCVDHDAGAVRMTHLLRILVELGCRVTFMALNRRMEGEHTRALQAAGVEALYEPTLSSIDDHLRRAGGRYELVIMSRAEVVEEVLPAVRRHCPRARCVFDTVDLHFLREARRAQVTGALDDDAVAALEARELALARACDLTLVVSPTERDLLFRLAPDLAVEILSLIDARVATDTPFEERSGVLFVGNFQHPPNRDSIEHYLREIHPLVREREPAAEITIIGAQAPRSLRRLAGDGARFVGQVPDLTPYFSAARLSVAPLRFGAGIKGKIQTSLALGVPVVTTSVGAEGMSLEDGSEALIADDARSFAEAVVRLHTDAQLWTRVAGGGHRAAEERYSPARAEEVLARIVSARS